MIAKVKANSRNDKFKKFATARFKFTNFSLIFVEIICKVLPGQNCSGDIDTKYQFGLSHLFFRR